jgi:hypothetical protein
MPDPNTIPSLMSNWSVKGPTPYLPYWLICVLLAISVRVVHCFIKALSVGEYTDNDEKNKKLKAVAEWPFKKRFGHLLWGFDKENAIADNWLGAIIGFAEISFYPVLIFTNNLAAIGGWLVIKTAGQWKMWQDSPMDFNRFLVTNLINLAIAYFITAKWIQ